MKVSDFQKAYLRIRIFSFLVKNGIMFSVLGDRLSMNHGQWVVFARLYNNPFKPIPHVQGVSVELANGRYLVRLFRANFNQLTPIL